MNYEGKLYGRVGGNFFDTGVTTKEVDSMVSLRELQSHIDRLLKESKEVGYLTRKELSVAMDQVRCLRVSAMILFPDECSDNQ